MSEMVCECRHGVDKHHATGCGFMYQAGYYCGCNKTDIQLYKIEIDALRKQLEIVKARYRDVIDDKPYWSEDAVNLCIDILAEINKIGGENDIPQH